MNLFRYAQFLQIKYKISESSEHLEKLLRSKIRALYSAVNSYNILRICADSNASKPKNAYERKAVVGYKFCQEVVTIVDFLQSNEKSISLGELREALLNLTKLISSNKDLRFDTNGEIDENGEENKVQFPHVSELIFQIFPNKTVKDRQERGAQFAKARTGLSRLLSISVDMLEDIKKLELMVPEKFTHKITTDVDINAKSPERFAPQRGLLSHYDIVDFIRQYGDEYGISSHEDWELALRNDHQLREQMTTVINALNRGHYPRDSADVKMQIAEIIRNYEERKQNNASVFEDSNQSLPESPPRLMSDDERRRLIQQQKESDEALEFSRQLKLKQQKHDLEEQMARKYDTIEPSVYQQDDTKVKIKDERKLLDKYNSLSFEKFMTRGTK